GPYTSYQVNVNVNGNNVVGDAANEPSICVDPTNGNKMSIGWRQFDSGSSNFRQAGFAHTANGGRTWISASVLQHNVFRSDPVLNSDNAGHFFYLSLLQNFFDDLWRSLDGGQSWISIAPADGGDKQWFTIDTTNSTGHGFQYQSWSTDGNNYAGRQFTRSTNGGLTWMNPINIPNFPAWGTLDIDSSGNLFIGGVNLNSEQIWCVRSTNAKNGAVVPTFDQSRAVNLTGSMTIPLITRSGTGLARFRSRLTAESMQSGWTHVMLRTISTRNSSIRTAWMAEIPGRSMSQSAIRLTRTSVIRIRTSS